MPNIDTSNPPIANVKELILFGMGENEEWVGFPTDALDGYFNEECLLILKYLVDPHL